MSRKGIAAIAALAVLVLAAAIWTYSDYGLLPGSQMPPDGVNPNGSSQSESEAMVLADLKGDWMRLEQGPLKHSAESGHWFLDAAEFIGPAKILVHFEDGLYDEYALLERRDDSTFEVVQRFQDRTEFQSLRASSSYSSTVYQYNPDRGTFTANPEYKVFDPAPAADSSMEVKIAWLNPEGNLPDETKPGDLKACDNVVLIERMVPRTSAPLRAALEELLKDKTHTTPPGTDGLYNYIANGNLQLESVAIEDRVAKIRLTGTPPPVNGVCDEPRLLIQVTQTARQFPSVLGVFLWVNGVLRTQPPDPDMAP